MKIAAIIVFLAFLTVPTLLLVFSSTAKLLVRGAKGDESLSKPTVRLDRLKPRRRLYYSILISYNLFFLASLVWLGYEFSDVAISIFGLSLGQLIVIVAPISMWLIGISAWSVVRTQRVLKTIPPPEAGSDGAFSEWQNRRRNTIVDTLSQNLLRNLLIVWITGIIVAGFSILLTFFLR